MTKENLWLSQEHTRKFAPGKFHLAAKGMKLGADAYSDRVVIVRFAGKHSGQKD